MNMELKIVLQVRSLDGNVSKNVGLGNSSDSIGEADLMDGSYGNAQRHNSVPAVRNVAHSGQLNHSHCSIS
ncbi:hypothetical protein Bca101_042569 [Brassica carinata]